MSFQERVQQLPALGLGVSTEYGAADAPGSLDVLGLVDPVFGRLRHRVGQAAGDKDVSSVLGFNPLAAIRALLRR